MASSSGQIDPKPPREVADAAARGLGLRHAGSKEGEDDPSAGCPAWVLRAGDPGQDRAQRMARALDDA